MNWTQAIDFMSSYLTKVADDLHINLIWRRIQNGDRTQDLLMTIAALKDLDNESLSASPEWTDAIHWLTNARAQGQNLYLDLLSKQLETGDRTNELLALIQNARQVEGANSETTSDKPSKRR